VPVPTRAGDVIAGKYRIERVLGAGGMGVVVEAFHLSLDEKVAIKYLKPEALENPASVERFAREARASAKIKSEHVCRVLDVLVEDGVPYLVMEYLEGRDLDDLVTKEGALSVEDGVDYILQACEALAEAHVAGIVHRDLKPANLFLSRRADGSPVVKVLDFGISKVQPRPGAQDAAMTATSSLLGSPLYMSPEQMRATKGVDARTDVWSIGVILYEMLTGSRPFEGETVPAICAQILAEAPVPLGGRVSRAVEAVILRCLEKRPEDRFQSVAELAEALRPSAAPRSTLSIDRVVRVIAQRGRSDRGSSKPVIPPSPRASGPGGEAWSSPTVDASVDAPAPLSLPARTGPAGTQAAFERVAERPARAGRVVLALGAALLLVGVAALFIVLRVGRPKAASSGLPVGAASPVRADLPAPPIPPVADLAAPPIPPMADTPPPPLPAVAAIASAPPAASAPPPVAAGGGKLRPPPPPRPPVGKPLGPPPVPSPPPAKPGFGGRD
jgi:eukaryotic-like serine/threonine-protein kinase